MSLGLAHAASVLDAATSKAIARPTRWPSGVPLLGTFDVESTGSIAVWQRRGGRTPRRRIAAGFLLRRPSAARSEREIQARPEREEDAGVGEHERPQVRLRQSIRDEPLGSAGVLQRAIGET